MACCKYIHSTKHLQKKYTQIHTYTHICTLTAVPDRVVAAVSHALYNIDPRHAAMKMAGYISVTPAMSFVQ
jgi:hypothetical protein